MNSKKIFIIAGEHSGDLHGSNLIKALYKKDPKIEISGVGGEKMKAAGCTIVHDLTDLAVIGFIEVLKHYRKIREIFYNLLDYVKKEKPDTVILIDYPGFNLRFAKELKDTGIKVIYYISPQIWAWKKRRIHDIKKHIDLMLVILDFEEQLYIDHDIPVNFVGHPLIDILKPETDKETFYEEINFRSKKLVALLPGSRNIEIERILPVLLSTAEKINETEKDISFVLPYKATNKALMEEIKKNYQIDNLVFTEDKIYNIMKYADLVLVASGTATLETACFNTPLIIVYKTSLFTWLLAKTLLRIKFIGIVNIIAKTEIAPEFVQFDATAAKIAPCAINMLKEENNKKAKQNIKEKVIDKMDKGGASEKAADAVLSLISHV